MRTPVVVATTLPAVVAAVAGTLVATLGVALSRVDLVLVALPLLVGAAWARDRRPSPDAATEATLDVEARGAAGWRYRVGLRAPVGVDAVHVRLQVLGGEPHDLVVDAAAAERLEGVAPALHSGPQDVVSVEHRVVGPDGAWVGGPVGPLVAHRAQAPALAAVPALVLPLRLQGLTGAHDSARPGDGGELRDVHPFAPGDRLRRIDWKATARRAQRPGELYVRRAAATADATVVLVLDARDDVGQNVADWAHAEPWEQGVTSLDLARQAAASLAVAYSRAGDRVGFQDLSTTNRLVRPGGGSRHLDRVLGAVAATRASGVRAPRRRPPVLAPGALVYLLSTFLDDEPVALATRWRAAGHRVVAVDVLPRPATGGLDPRARTAFGVLRLEREDRVARLAAGGVDVLAWSQAHEGERAATLRALARPARRGAR